MPHNKIVAARRGERRVFEHYLRTGRIAIPPRLPGLQVKFNPWHDPDDGRFTFAGQGNYFGGGGASGSYSEPTQRHTRRSSEGTASSSSRTDTFKPGGGSSGGGGASGSWPSSSANQPATIKPGGGSFGGGGASGSWTNSSSNQTNSPQPQGGSFGDGGAGGSWPAESSLASNGPKVTPSLRIASQAASHQSPAKRPTSSSPTGTATEPATLRVSKNGYNFDVNSEAGTGRRTEHVSGELRLAQTTKRSRSAQSRAGGADRKPTDDGGHFIAARFNGPRDWFNHFAQNSSFNRGIYRAIEDGRAKEIKAGRRVFVDIVPHYAGSSARPDKLTIRWTVGNEKYVKEFPNGRKGK